MGSLLIGNGHLFIRKTNIKSGVNNFPCFDESKIIEKEWNSPSLSTNKEAMDWIVNKQPFYIEDYLEKNGVFSNLKMLNENYDNAFSDLIVEDRNKKLETIGI